MRRPNIRTHIGDLAVGSLARVTRQRAIARRIYREILEERRATPAIDFLAFCQVHRSLGGGQFLQDLWVLFETGMMREGYFVEFGAADGVLHSNTLRLEADMGWNGLLAEPNSDFESALRRNRSADVDVRCVWPTSGAFVDLLVTDDPELSTVAGPAVSDAHSRARQTVRRVHRVETISLMDLLEEHQAPRLIDYLSIDTEGSELGILSAFDFSQYEIHLVSVEHNYRDDERSLDALMTSKGFERRFSEFSACDAWYRRKS